MRSRGSYVFMRCFTFIIFFYHSSFQCDVKRSIYGLPHEYQSELINFTNGNQLEITRNQFKSLKRDQQISNEFFDFR